MNDDFDGETFEYEFDASRLGKQLKRVYGIMSDGRWRIPREMELLTGDNWASIGARLRDLRKEKFGGFGVERRARGERTQGLFEYRLQQRGRPR
tara:strand:+ start:189 stop:470 length:282 start_codon:yes stop_codon:yes gene_type:complete